MLSAPQWAGFITADRGTWRLEKPRSTIQGSYKAQGEDVFSTTGEIKAEWARIPAKTRAARVDYDLLQPMLTSAGVGAGATQRAPVDPALIGIWEGQGTKDGVPVELVWMIFPNGASGIVWVMTQEGRLETQQERLRFVTTSVERVKGRHK